MQGLDIEQVLVNILGGRSVAQEHPIETAQDTIKAQPVHMLSQLTSLGHMHDVEPGPIVHLVTGRCPKKTFRRGSAIPINIALKILEGSRKSS